MCLTPGPRCRGEKWLEKGRDVESGLGSTRWAIAEGYVPAWGHGPKPEMESHEAVCILNAGERDAEVRLTLYFTDREPAGPYRIRVGARRTEHVRLNDLTEPEPVPRGTG